MSRTVTRPRDLHVGDHVVVEHLDDDMRLVQTVQRVDDVEYIGNNRYRVDIGDDRRYVSSRAPYLVTDEPLTRTVDNEPPHASVVMLYGPTGTAYQRSHADGLWYAAMVRAAGHGVTWADLCARPKDGSVPLVVHTAPEEG